MKTITEDPEGSLDNGRAELPGPREWTYACACECQNQVQNGSILTGDRDMGTSLIRTVLYNGVMAVYLPVVAWGCTDAHDENKLS